MLDDQQRPLKEQSMSWCGFCMRYSIQGLKVAKTSLNRGIDVLRNRFSSPIACSRFPCTYFSQSRAQGNNRWTVKRLGPTGIRLSLDEATALPTVRPLLVDIEPGILSPKLKPLTDKLNRLLDSYGNSVDTINSRIKATQAGKRRLVIVSFQSATRGTLDRKRLRMTHFNRHDGKECRTRVQRAQLRALGRYV